MLYERKMGMPVNERFFHPPFTEKSAYILGFLAGDGWIDGNYVAVVAADVDKEHIRAIRDALGSQHNILIRNRQGGRYHRLKVGSKKLTKQLNKLGISANKSLTYDPQNTIKFLKKSLHRHFFRGMVEADGHIGNTERPRVVLTGTEAVCQSFLDFIRSNDIHTKAIPRPSKSNVFCAYIGGRLLTAKVCMLLYHKSRIALPRKIKKAVSIYKGE